MYKKTWKIKRSMKIGRRTIQKLTMEQIAFRGQNSKILYYYINLTKLKSMKAMG